MRKSYDKKSATQPDFKIGDKVLLNARNVKTRRHSKKLDQLYRGPCTIKKQIGTTAFELELPPQL